MKVAILGAGRMGQALVQSIEGSDDLSLAGVWSRSAGASIVVDHDLGRVLRRADVAIDFTLPGATADILDQVTHAAVPLVCGVTGLDAPLIRRLAEAARSIPLLYDRNMSPGVAVLTELVALAGASLQPPFAASIAETHHLNKRDAPSGTALKLGEALAQARRQHFRDVYRYRPGGAAERRSVEDIVVTAERRGKVAGEHIVRFESGIETLTLSHSVADRRVFAAGALLAARWLVRRGPGLYGMRDVVQARAAGGGEQGRDSVD